MQITNIYNLPEPIVNAVKNDPYNAQADISATTLSKSPRIRMLEKRHWSKIRVDVTKRIRLLVGKAVHYVLEVGEAAGHVKEQRLFAQVDGWTVSGQYDLLRLNGGMLQDYKTILAQGLMMGEKPEWASQLNVLAWLLAYGQTKDGERVAYQVERLQIVPIVLDWSEVKKTDPKYPQVPVPVVDIDLWPLPKTEAWIKERVALHQAAAALPDHELPLCTPEERWQRESTYAVMQPGRKRAVNGGVCDTKADAEAYMAKSERKDLYIEERPSEAIRCERYCLVKEFCSQYAASIPQGLEGMAVSPQETK